MTQNTAEETQPEEQGDGQNPNYADIYRQIYGSKEIHEALLKQRTVEVQLDPKKPNQMDIKIGKDEVKGANV